MSQPEDFTIGWICALDTFVTASALLDEEYPDVHTVSRNDENNYKLGRFGQHRVAIAVLPGGEYGLSSAAMVARDMVHTFSNLRFGLMVGIGGGAPTPKHPVRLGDVVVSQPSNGHGGVFQYDFGKAVQDHEFHQTGHLDQPPRVLRTAVTRLKGEHELDGHHIQQHVAVALERRPRLAKKYGRPTLELDVLYRSEVTHPHETDGECSELCSRGPTDVILRDQRTPDEDDPSISYGLIASANTLMKDAKTRDQLAKRASVLCFEMEAAGLMNNFPCLVIRGICDYADTHKNKAWQGYAAMTAAAYAKELLARIAPEDVQSTRQYAEVPKEIHSGIETVNSSVKEVAKLHKERNEQYANSQHLLCHQVFKTCSYEGFKNKNPERIKGTCSWVLQHQRFRAWRESSHSDLLWISADPGCGKSVLAKAFVDDAEFSVAERATTCYFFFKDTDDQNSLPVALCALLHQLFSQRPHLLSHALGEWNADGEKLRLETDKLWRMFCSAALDPNAGVVICVLDALDECRQQDRAQLIEFLSRFYDAAKRERIHKSKVKFVATSRPYSDLERKFDAIPEIRLQGEEETETIRREIDLVIRQSVDELAKEVGIREAVQRQLEKKLLDMEHRTYLWLYLAKDAIRQTYAKSWYPEKESIDKLPSSVQDAYEKMLAKIVEDKDYRARQVLGVVAGCRRPLSIEELAYALGIGDAIADTTNITDLEVVAIRVDLAKWIRQHCGLFISFSDSRAYLIHQTAKDFLISSKEVQGQAWKWCFRSAEIDELMARICIAALLSQDFSTLAAVEGSTSRSTFSSNSKSYWLRYCAENWTNHLRVAYQDISSNAKTDINCLHNPDDHRCRLWFQLAWLEESPYEDIPTMDQVRLCAFTGYRKWLQQALAWKDPRLEKRDEDGRTALYWASVRGLIDSTIVLLDKGADVNAQGRRHGTALQAASAEGHESVVQVLLDRGADVNAQGGGIYGTALQAASVRGHESVVQVLLDRGADVNAQGGGIYGTALQAASARGHESVVQMLHDKAIGEQQDNN